MPLHDWTDERGWDSVHPVWLTYLLEYVQERLPEGYKAFLGGVPSLTVDSGHGKPDVSVRQWGPEPAAETVTSGTGVLEPDLEASVAFRLDPQRALHIDFHGQLIAALELVSPRNKDRADAKETYSQPLPGLPPPGRASAAGRCAAAPEGLLVLGRHHERPGSGPAAAAAAVRRGVPRRRGRPGRRRHG